MGIEYKDKNKIYSQVSSKLNDRGGYVPSLMYRRPYTGEDKRGTSYKKTRPDDYAYTGSRDPDSAEWRNRVTQPVRKGEGRGEDPRGLSFSGTPSPSTEIGAPTASSVPVDPMAMEMMMEAMGSQRMAMQTLAQIALAGMMNQGQPEQQQQGQTKPQQNQQGPAPNLQATLQAQGSPDMSTMIELLMMALGGGQRTGY